MANTWQQPKLLILTRGRPEERILAVCKAGGSGTDPTGDHQNCVAFVEVECLICYDAATS